MEQKRQRAEGNKSSAHLHKEPPAQTSCQSLPTAQMKKGRDVQCVPMEVLGVQRGPAGRA